MKVFHGTSAEFANCYVRDGIDAHLLYPRLIHGLQDKEPGLFVTPRLAVARRFGLYVVEIEVELFELRVPPEFRKLGETLEKTLSYPFEPQALLVSRVEPNRVNIIESYPDGYPFNPYDD